MGCGPYPLPHPVDTAVVARLNSALVGGVHHYAADRDLALAIEAKFPGTGDQLRAARRFHSDAALWAVTEGGARGIVTMAAGFPCRPDPHEAALAEVPGARAVYMDPAESVTLVNRAVLGGHHVCACPGIVRDPAGMLAAREVSELPRPLCVILRMVLQYWPADAAAAITAMYGSLLPSGSYLAVSMVVPSPEAVAAVTGMLRDARIRVYRHEPEDLAAWLDKARLEMMPPGIAERMVPPGVADVRAWPGRTWADEHFAELAPGRIVGALARVR